LANTNRNKGHNAEREYAKIFKDELGYSFCVTSRYGSRLHDDSAIDLLNTGKFNVQIKAGRQSQLNYSKTLLDMKTRVQENFPPEANEHNNIDIIIHKKDSGQGKPRTPELEIVVMRFEDFKKIIKNND
jgi:hypothetical protein